MILWTGKEERETTPRYPDLGRRAWRWVLDVEGPSTYHGVRYLLSISLDQQVQIERDGDWWSGGVDYYAITVNDQIMWGHDHAYYDGPRCSFSVGPVHFSWRGKNCKRCMP